jgi:hypothetical protein
LITIGFGGVQRMVACPFSIHAADGIGQLLNSLIRKVIFQIRQAVPAVHCTFAKILLPHEMDLSISSGFITPH